MRRPMLSIFLSELVDEQSGEVFLALLRNPIRLTDFEYALRLEVVRHALRRVSNLDGLLQQEAARVLRDKGGVGARALCEQARKEHLIGLAGRLRHAQKLLAELGLGDPA